MSWYNEYLCQPCDHRWWQHRHPDQRMRVIGMFMVVQGALFIVLGIVEIATH